jgi:hypothetical protein
MPSFGRDRPIPGDQAYLSMTDWKLWNKFIIFNVLN